MPLQPQGTLVLSIKSVWLQHYSRAGAAELDGAAETGSVASSATLFDGVDTDERERRDGPGRELTVPQAFPLCVQTAVACWPC